MPKPFEGMTFEEKCDEFIREGLRPRPVPNPAPSDWVERHQRQIAARLRIVELAREEADEIASLVAKIQTELAKQDLVVSEKEIRAAIIEVRNETKS
jgi:hypothetical protein